MNCASPQTRSSCTKMLCFSSMFSETASITPSELASASRSVSSESLASAAAPCSSEIRPRDCKRLMPARITDCACASCPSSTSTSVTSTSANSAVCAIPDPIVPAPKTPSCCT